VLHIKGEYTVEIRKIFGLMVADWQRKKMVRFLDENNKRCVIPGICGQIKERNIANDVIICDAA